MNLSQHMLHPPEYPLQGFGGKPIKPVGKISLPVSFGDLDNARTENLTFDVSTYITHTSRFLAEDS
jgi:hypothetical protein